MAGSILLTGGKGFVGSALLVRLRELGYHVEGEEFELREPKKVRAAVGGEERDWDVVIHLAGESSVAACENHPDKARAVNVEGTRNLVEAVMSSRGRRHFIFASTAQLYRVEGDGPIKETAPVEPPNLYARTKLEAEELLEDATDSAGFPLTILRPFNHTGRKQPPLAFVPAIWKRLQEAVATGDREIRVGNLNLWRDIGHVDDLVAAVVALIEREAKRGGRPRGAEIFNVCTGKYKHLEIIARLLALEADLPTVRFDTDPRLLREGEPLIIVGSHAALTAETGWRPGCQSEEELVKRFLAR